MYKIYVDAAFDPKTKAAGIAFNAIVDGHQTIQQQFVSLVQDNHEAEFQAMWLAMQYLEKQAHRNSLIQIHSDSKIVVQSIEKHYVRDEVYAKWLDKILPVMGQFSLLFIRWIPEKENRAADQAARQVLRKENLQR